jgi:hypothetical protein
MGKFSVTGVGCAVRNEKSTMDMVNARSVNAGPSYFSPTAFLRNFLRFRSIS